ncbi:MAG TPA: hypothetical protein VMS73_06125, partial [Anaerolineaceae bacterium]|nr:hypothetical protein [Anaerolineaceae bacterium]
MKTVFYRIVLYISGVALILNGLALVDFVLHPAAGDHNFHSALFRAVSVLVVIPLTLLVGFLIIRRVPGNVVGPLLIMWSGSVAYYSIRDDIGQVWFSLYYFYNIAFGWFSLFLLILHFPDGTIYPPVTASWIYRIAIPNVLSGTLIFLSQAVLPVPAGIINPF